MFPAAASDQAKLLAEADTLLHTGDAAAARARYEAVLAQNKASATAQEGEVRASEQLALAARAKGDFKGAFDDLQRAQGFAPDNYRLLYDVAVVEEQMGHPRDANTLVSRLRQLRPDDDNALYLAARVELDLALYPAAEKDLRTYLSKHPSDASASYGLGHLLMMEQRIPEARVAFARSIELQPMQTESYYQLGQIATDLGQEAEAKPLLMRALARDPKHGGALTCMGILAYRSKAYDEARKWLSAAVQSSPDYQPAHYYYGLKLNRLGEKEPSKVQLAEATRLAAAQQTPQPSSTQSH